MIRTIIQKEIFAGIRSFRFTVVALLLVMLISSSMFVMYRDYMQRMENYTLLSPKDGEKTMIVQPAVLSIFVKGLDEVIGRSYAVSFGGQISPGGTDKSASNLFMMFMTPDLHFIVRVVLSLVALLFSFDIVSGEKESRTLSLSLANTVSRTTLLAGKWIGGYITIAAPFIVMVFAGVLVITLMPEIQFSGADWIRLALFLGGSLLYIACFFTLGMLVSIILSSSSSALIIALTLWTVFVFVIPSLGNTVAGMFVAKPSVQQYEIRRNNIWIREVFLRIQAIKTEKRDTGRDMIANINRDNDLLRADFNAKFTAFKDLTKTITSISPAAAFTYFATDIAGTGIREENRLREHVVRYKDGIWEIGQNSKEKPPPFSYRRGTVRDALYHGGILELALMMLVTIVFFSLSYVRFLRYDAR